MAWMTVMIFIPVFAPSLPVLAFGEAMCGVSWGVFQVCLDLTWQRAVTQLILLFPPRPSLRHMLLRLSPLFSDHMSPPMSACAGVLVFSSPLVSSEP